MKPSPSPPAIAVVDLYHLSFDGMLTDGIWLNVNIGTPLQSVALLFDLGSSVIAAPPLNLTESTDTCQICPGRDVTVCQYPQCVNSTIWYNDDEDSVLPKGWTGYFDPKKGVYYYDNTNGTATWERPTTTAPCVLGYYEPESSSTVSYLSSSIDWCKTGKANTDRCPVAAGYGGPQAVGCNHGFAGDIAFDMLSIGGYSGNVSLVPITTIQSEFQTPPVAGIMGVAFEEKAFLPGNFGAYVDPKPPKDVNASFVGVESVGDAFTMFLDGAGLANEFSMCMGTPNKAGKLVLGGIDDELYSGDFQTVDMSHEDPGEYAVSVNRIEIGGKPMPGNSSDYFGALVNSGNPFFNLPNLPFINTFLSSEGVSCTVDTDCNIGIVMDGNVTLDVLNYVTCNTTANKCNPITSAWVRDDVGDTVILGYALLSHFYTHFNRAKKTIGFAKPASACSPNKLLKPYNKP